MTYYQRKLRRTRSRARPRNKVMLAVAVVLLVGIIGALSVIGYIAAIAASAPNIDELKPIDKGASSVIFAADGSRLGYFQSDDVRMPITFKDMPLNVRCATYDIDDERI